MRPIVFFLLIALLYGCKENAGCTQFGSENFDQDAIVDDGSCIHIRDKFIGTFNVISDCFSEQQQLIISEASDDYMVTITNLGDTLPTVQANVYGNNITIDRQPVAIGVTVEGAGVYSEEAAISLSYRIRDSRSGSEIITDCIELCSKAE